ncbi:hypothetical protein DFQ26_004567 [Actinomortierella ambigua]|nr:hypothetical protein DFQ26_004567 [Actinomortierella ambigua]
MFSIKADESATSTAGHADGENADEEKGDADEQKGDAEEESGNGDEENENTDNEDAEDGADKKGKKHRHHGKKEDEDDDNDKENEDNDDDIKEDHEDDDADDEDEHGHGHHKKDHSHHKHGDDYKRDEPDEWENDEADADTSEGSTEAERLFTDTDEDIEKILDKIEAMIEAETSILSKYDKHWESVSEHSASNNLKETEEDGNTDPNAANPKEAGQTSPQSPATQGSGTESNQQEQNYRHDHRHRSPQELPKGKSAEWREQLLERIKERKKVLDELRRKHRIANDPIISIQPVSHGSGVVGLLPIGAAELQKPSSENGAAPDQANSPETRKAAQLAPSKGEQQQHHLVNLPTHQQPQRAFLKKRGTTQKTEMYTDMMEEEEEDDGGADDVKSKDSNPLKQWTSWVHNMAEKTRDAMKLNITKLKKLFLDEGEKIDDAFSDNVSEVEDTMKEAEKQVESELKKKKQDEDGEKEELEEDEPKKKKHAQKKGKKGKSQSHLQEQEETETETETELMQDEEPMNRKRPLHNMEYS